MSHGPVSTTMWINSQLGYHSAISIWIMISAQVPQSFLAAYLQRLRVI